MRCGLVLAGVFVSVAWPVLAEEGFPLTGREAKLEGCVETARDVGSHVEICAGAVMELCLAELTPEAAAGIEGFMCLQEEAFAWDNVALRASHAYVAQIEGRQDFSHEPFVAEMGERLAVETETCFDEHVAVYQDASKRGAGDDFALSWGGGVRFMAGQSEIAERDGCD